jgi:lysine 2,3-aminomutase
MTAELLPEGTLVHEHTAHHAHGDWQMQLRRAARSASDLGRVIELTPEELAGALRAEREGLPIAVTPYYLGLCDPRDPRCPIRLQCVPRVEEQEEVIGDLVDPLGEVRHEVAPYLVRRYPDRALLLATDQCAVYCRFCTRSRIVGDGSGPTPLARLEAAFSWIEAHPEIRDVIISGGDPLAMSTDRIDRLLARVRAIPTVETIRLATRVPVTLPMRVTRELVHALRKHHPVWVMTHFNHPKELTEASRNACESLADAGFPVMNQTVLLRGVNDDANVLAALFRGLVRVRVRPYYLLQADPVRGSAHLRTPLERGITLMEQLQGRLSGIALPKLICDTPGGRGKVPLSPDYVVSRGNGRTLLRTFRGEQAVYVDPPATQ